LGIKENKMKIDVTEDGSIRLKDVFNGVLFETDDGEKLGVCMRDGGFEISVKKRKDKDNKDNYVWYRIMDGKISLL